MRILNSLASWIRIHNYDYGCVDLEPYEKHHSRNRNTGAKESLCTYTGKACLPRLIPKANNDDLIESDSPTNARTSRPQNHKKTALRRTADEIARYRGLTKEKNSVSPQVCSETFFTTGNKLKDTQAFFCRLIWLQCSFPLQLLQHLPFLSLLVFLFSEKRRNGGLLQ